MTVMLVTSVDSSQKLKSLMIGKFSKPCYTKNIIYIPLSFRSNKKAWMANILFTERLLSIDSDIKKKIVKF